MDETALIASIHRLLNAEAASGSFSGAVMVARDDQPLLTAARGHAVQPELVPNRADTRFNIASITKMLTAVAVMQLVGAGKLDLRTRIAKASPDLPHAARITAHQLLVHTAGFGRYWNDAYRARRSDLRSVDDYLELFAGIPLEFAPGERHPYGNSGYVVLGALIERITGKTYFDYMRESVYSPAQMQDIGHDEMNLPHARRAIGYTRQNGQGPEDGQLRSNEFIYAVKGSPAEHCFSTVEDLFRFFGAFDAGRLLDRQLAQACLTAYAEAE